MQGNVRLRLKFSRTFLTVRKQYVDQRLGPLIIHCNQIKKNFLTTPLLAWGNKINVTAYGFNNPCSLMPEPVQWTTPSLLVTPTVCESSPLAQTVAPLNSSPPSLTPGARSYSILTACHSSSTEILIRLPLTRGEIAIAYLSEEARILFKNKVKVNADQAAVMESSTWDQSDNNDCFKYRQCRLTDSNFGAVLKRKKQDC